MSTNQHEHKMSVGAYIWYYLINIISFGSLYFIKTAVKKALVEDK